MKNKYIITVLLLLFITMFAVYYFIFYSGSQIVEISDKQTSGENEKGTSGALQSLQFLTELRAYPEKDIPQDKFFAAFEHTKNNMQEFPRVDAGIIDSWQSIGPNNIGGRTLSLALHPADTSIIYMGAASGGLWKSTTGGFGATAWSYVETGYPSLAVSSIIIDSLNPSIMYIGTGENYGTQYSSQGVDIRVTRGMYGIGILKTTNGGASWTKSLDWTYSSQRGVWKVIFNPKNHNVLYAATSEGIWKSVNAGATWFQQLNYLMAVDLEINPSDTSVLYTSIGNLTNNIPNANVGIYKSTNSGANWTKLTAGLPATWTGKTQIELYKPNPNRIVASVANDFSSLGLYLSTDAGASWALLSGTSSNYLGSQGWYTNPLYVKDNDSSKVIVGGVDLFRSTTGGSNLSSVSDWSAWLIGQIVPPGGVEGSSPDYAHADHHGIISNYKDANKLYIATDGGLFRSNDFGTSYFGCNGGYQTTQFYNGFANSMTDSNFSLGGLQDNATARYEGTNSWRKVYGGDGFWCAINSGNNSIAYISYTYASIQRSTDGAINNFNSTGPPSSGSGTQYCFSAPYVLSQSNPQVMYAGGVNLYKSTSGGGAWQNMGSLGYKALSMDVSSTDPNIVYVGTSVQLPGGTAKIFRLVGSTLTDVSNGQIPNRYVTDIHIDPFNSANVYASFGGFGTGHIYKTTNSGTSWQDISGNLPDVPHQSVCIDPLYPQNIYAGNDLGVFVSTTGGNSWYEFKAGMPYAMVFDLKIVETNRMLRAATHGNGVYQRKLVESPIGITQTGNEIPKEFKLGQNYPNPFNPSTKIKFSIPQSSARGVLTKLFVYDISGRLVRTLVNQTMNAGSYEVTFDGNGLASGVYFYKLLAGSYVETKKMLMIK